MAMKKRNFVLRVKPDRCNFSVGYPVPTWESIVFAGWGRSPSQMDTLTRAERSKRMALIRSKDTKPELFVRRIARSCGIKFRLHVVSLAGSPDLVFPKQRKAIFVHGCFWHRHPNCVLARLPKTKRSFWIPKLSGNRRRDLRNISRLRRDGWKVLTIWECQLRNGALVEKRVKKFLERTNAKR